MHPHEAPHHPHTHTPVYLSPHVLTTQRSHLRPWWAVVVKCRTLFQVAMTDLEDVVDGGGQRLAYEGYL